VSLANGTRLGPYEILSPLGAGGMGEVYRARDTRLGPEVAVKVLPAKLAQDPERLHRFEREARARGECPKYIEKPMDDLLRQLDGEKIRP
jgi:serine/threonine protein kinase